MFNLDIVRKIEKILSDILSDKHECDITIKFVKGADIDGDCHTSEIINQK